MVFAMFFCVDQRNQAAFLNELHGRNKVVVASQGFNSLQMNRRHLSKNYTSDWADIITVKV